MRHRDLINDPHPSRAAVAGMLALLILGIALGAAIGMALSRAFELADLEERARDFRRPAAAAPVVPDNLRS